MTIPYLDVATAISLLGFLWRVAVWKTKIESELEKEKLKRQAVEKDVAILHERDKRIYDKLDEILHEIQSVKERLAVLESK